VLTSIRLSHYEVHFVYKYEGEKKVLVDLEKWLKEATAEQLEEMEQKFLVVSADPGFGSTVTMMDIFSFFFEYDRRLKVNSHYYYYTPSNHSTTSHRDQQCSATATATTSTSTTARLGTGSSSRRSRKW
jgi:hypothetical protein